MERWQKNHLSHIIKMEILCFSSLSLSAGEVHQRNQSRVQCIKCEFYSNAPRFVVSHWATHDYDLSEFYFSFLCVCVFCFRVIKLCLHWFCAIAYHDILSIYKRVVRVSANRVNIFLHIYCTVRTFYSIQLYIFIKFIGTNDKKYLQIKFHWNGYEIRMCVCTEASKWNDGQDKKNGKHKFKQSDLIHMPTFRLESIFMACANATRTFCSFISLSHTVRSVWCTGFYLSLNHIYTLYLKVSPAKYISRECANKQATISRLDITHTTWYQ